MTADSLTKSAPSPFAAQAPLYYLIAATLLVRLPWVFMVPMYEAPDENTHFYIIKYLADNLSLPGPADLTAGGQESVYVPVPQLGYLPHVAAYWLFGSIFDPSMAPRFGSLLLSPLTTLCAYWIGTKLFPSSKLCALALPWLVVFHPQLVFIHAYSNNDVTATTLSAVLLVLTIKMLEKGLSYRFALIIGALCGWLTLTKYSGYAVLPAVAAGFLVSALIHRTALKKLFLTIASCAATALALSAWWFVRNYHLYHGDFMGTQTMRTYWAALYNKPLTYYVSPIEIALNHKWWRMMWFSYWGHFGYMTRPLIKPLYWIYTGFLALSAGMNVRELIMRRNFFKQFFQQKASFKDLMASKSSNVMLASAWTIMGICLLSNLLAMILASTGNVGGPQGRYLFTSEIPFLALVLLGLNFIAPPWNKRLITALVAFNLIVYIWSFAMLFPIYGFRWKTF